MKKMLRSFIAILLAGTMLMAISCKKNEEMTSDTDTTSEVESGYQYDFGSMDFGGKEIVILNTPQSYGFTTTFILVKRFEDFPTSAATLLTLPEDCP